MIVAVGECMIELSGVGEETCRLGYGGDTLNTAVYLSRLGHPAGFLTAIGCDPFSDRLADAWAREGLDLSLVLRDPARLPGLYAITTDSEGERSFCYWRGDSAARFMMGLPDSEAVFERAASARLIYLSGITLSLFDDTSRRRLFALCEAVRAAGGRVAFDPNYRPRGWRSREAARSAVGAFSRMVDIALPTLSDESALWGLRSADEVIAWWRRAGASEVALKLGADGAMISAAAPSTHVTTPHRPEVVDTTGAGDGFNAAYLAAREAGVAPVGAAAQGNRLAAAIIEHPGAIIARSAMPPATMRASGSAALTGL
jgi:2-dehydro-3-deoxygluconokinase